MSENGLNALEDNHVREVVAKIVDKDTGVESRNRCAVDGSLTGIKLRLDISAAVSDALRKGSMVDALVDAFKDHEVNKQHLIAYMIPVDERIAAEYVASVQSATISALRNESVVSELEPCTTPKVL